MGGELFTLFAKLTLDTSEFDKNTDESRAKASVFGDVLKADLVGKGITAAWDGLKKLGGAVKSFTSEAVNAYGNVEQLSGGIETLFGDSAQKVMEDAQKAFETAGMNAADYMETSIQSAASLINSLGGDQAKAADLMNMSITDMSDNVNKMGTSMEAVQNAYRGFSRGNFTMLDNLALGFAGTKEGMQDLLDKAEELSGVEYDISSYSDIVQAIHVVQDEMGITGTTAREASETIEGSVSAMKSAWENLIAGIASPDADLGTLISNVVDTADTALHNIMPVVKRGLEGITKAVSELAPKVLEEVPDILGEIGPMVGDIASAFADAMGSAFESIDLGGVVLPMLVGLSGTLREKASELTEVGAELLSGLGTGMVENVSTLAEPISTILTNMVSIITDNAPILVQSAANIVTTLGSGISSSLPGFLQNTVLPILTRLSETLRTNAGIIVDAGISFILSLTQGIMDSLPTLLAQVPQIVINLAGVINDNAPKLLVAGGKMLIMIGKGLLDAIPALIENLPKIFEAVIAVWSAFNWLNLGKQVINFIRNGIKSLASNIPNAVKEIGNKAVDFFKGIDWSSAGTYLIDTITSAVTGLFSSIPNALKSIGESAWSAFKNVDWFSLGSNVIGGIVNGLSNGAERIKEAAKDVASKALQAAKDFLGIKSPSRVFRVQVGEMIGAGMALGIKDSEKDVTRAIKIIDSKLTSGLNRKFEFAPTEHVTGIGTKTDNSRHITVTNNITVDGAENPEEYASRLVRELELQLRTT